MKARILYKGLAFILMPLALQIVSFCLLYGLMMHSERLAAEEARTVRVVGWINSVATEFANSWGVIGNRTYGGAPGDQDEAELYKHRMDSLLDEGKELSVDNPHLTSIVDQTRKLAREQYQTMIIASRTQTERHSILGLIGAMAAMKPNLVRIGSHLSILNKELDEQRRAATAASDAERAARQQIKAQVIAGVVADVALTLLLLILFLKDITNRLNILVTNAKLIPSGQELKASVGGTDELSYLDKAIHQASDDLRDAAEARKQLMGMVAHDLRSPLQSAQLTLDGFVQRNAAELQSSQLSLLDSARLSVGTVTSLVEDLLTVDKLEAGKLELDKDLIDVHPLVDTVFEILQGLSAAKQIQLDNKTQAIAVEADEARLAQVLTNLVSNAIKFSPQGGRVVVSSAVAPKSIRIEVSDNGPGIPAEQQPLLFQKFQQAGGARGKGGYGLGLAIAKLIIQAHGGSIGIDSSPSSTGAKFWLELPTRVDLSDLVEPEQGQPPAGT